MSSSWSRTDPFDPYAFAVRWYEEHPEVLHDFELEIERVLKTGVTLDELDEIEDKAFEFGRLVRAAEIKMVVRRRVSARSDWEAYRNSLPPGTKKTATEAFRRGYGSMVKLSRTGLVSSVDLHDPTTGEKIGTGGVERTGSGHVIVHVNGAEVPSCIEEGFTLGPINIAEDTKTQ